MDDEIRVYKVIPTLLNDDAKKYLEGDINQIIFGRVQNWWVDRIFN